MTSHQSRLSSGTASIFFIFRVVHSIIITCYFVGIDAVEPHHTQCPFLSVAVVVVGSPHCSSVVVVVVEEVSCYAETAGGEEMVVVEQSIAVAEEWPHSDETAVAVVVVVESNCQDHCRSETVARQVCKIKLLKISFVQW